VCEEALRRRGIDASERIVTPAAALLALAGIAVAELAAIGITALGQQTSLILAISLAVLVVSAPHATLSGKARRAHAETRAVGAVVSQHALSGGGNDAGLGLPTPTTSLEIVARIACRSHFGAVLVAVVTFVRNWARSVVGNARRDSVAPNAALEIFVARLAVGLEAAGAVRERSGTASRCVVGLDTGSVAQAPSTVGSGVGARRAIAVLIARASGDSIATQSSSDLARVWQASRALAPQAISSVLLAFSAIAERSAVDAGIRAIRPRAITKSVGSRRTRSSSCHTLYCGRTPATTLLSCASTTSGILSTVVLAEHSQDRNGAKNKSELH